MYGLPSLNDFNRLIDVWVAISEYFQSFDGWMGCHPEYFQSFD